MDFDERTFIKPMLATPKKEIFDDEDWLYELKWDGYRMLSAVKNGSVNCYSRNGKSFTEKYRKITDSLEGISHEVMLDGEVVHIGENGIPNFQTLQNYPQNKKGELRYYVFDVLFLNGHSTVDLKLTDRKNLLPKIIEGCKGIFYCEHVKAQGEQYFKKALKKGMEGVVAKKENSVYESGHRSRDWLKIKGVDSHEGLICGYTESDKNTAFGSLILGVYDNDELTYIGNCGTGFSQKKRGDLVEKMKSIPRKTSPFSESIDLKGRMPHWVTPKLIAEVEFSEWTKTGKLRHPAFVRLRHDKKIKDIIKQTPIDEQ